MKQGDVTLTQANAVALARADDSVQGEFFKAFARECLSWGMFNAQCQMHMITSHLTDEECQITTCIGYKEKA